MASRWRRGSPKAEARRGVLQRSFGLTGRIRRYNWRRPADPGGGARPLCSGHTDARGAGSWRLTPRTRSAEGVNHSRLWSTVRLGTASLASGTFPGHRRMLTCPGPGDIVSVDLHASQKGSGRGSKRRRVPSRQRGRRSCPALAEALASSSASRAAVAGPGGQPISGRKWHSSRGA